MRATVRKVNGWFRSATRADVEELMSRIILSERQRRVMEMFYIRGMDIGYIADTLCVSRSVVSVELRAIRDRIAGVT